MFILDSSQEFERSLHSCKPSLNTNSFGESLEIPPKFNEVGQHDVPATSITFTDHRKGNAVYAHILSNVKYFRQSATLAKWCVKCISSKVLAFLTITAATARGA